MELLTINDVPIVGQINPDYPPHDQTKKVQVRKQKTPQGFNYLVVKESLMGYLEKISQMTTQQEPTIQAYTREHQPIAPDYTDQFRAEIDKFNTTMQRLIEQSSKDKENFFHLIKTFQERVGVLENQIKLLEAPSPSWWQFWK